jgi:NADPH2:quinone reductase
MKNYFVVEARRLTDGKGVDVIVDSVGGASLQASLHALAYRGRCVSVGNAGRSLPERIDVSSLGAGNQTLSAYSLALDLFLSEKPRAIIAGHPASIARGELRVVIDQQFALTDAGEARAYIESRQAFGRVVLVP